MNKSITFTRSDNNVSVTAYHYPSLDGGERVYFATTSGDVYYVIGYWILN